MADQHAVTDTAAAYPRLRSQLASLSQANTPLVVTERAWRTGRGSGRHTKLTLEIITKLEEHLQAGHYMETACRALGVPQDTVIEWLRRGRGLHPNRPSRPIYVRLARAVDAAMAYAEDRSLRKVVTSESPKDHQWFLERRHPSRWGPPAQGPLVVQNFTPGADSAALSGRRQDDRDVIEGEFEPTP